MDSGRERLEGATLDTKRQAAVSGGDEWLISTRAGGTDSPDPPHITHSVGACSHHGSIGWQPHS